MAEFSTIWVSFLAGLFTPLGAVCVLPLYPGYLAYLASQLKGHKGTASSQKKQLMLLVTVVASGIIFSLFLIGLLFTKLLSLSLTAVTAILSPIAFGILAIVSIFLIIDFEWSKVLPQFSRPNVKNPFLNAFLFGTFFAAIVLPCNPAPLIILFALSTSVTSFLQNLIGFIVFGIGMAFPLIVLSFISAQYASNTISFLTKNRTAINRTAGILMLMVALYYLFFVFKILG